MVYAYRNKLHRTLMDMHIDDWNPEFLSRYDPDAYFESLKIAQINAPMIYIQSHVGLCYWPTKSGEMHRAFIGREDAVKHLFDLCHAEGMDVVAYYSLIYNNWAYERHPEWRMRDVNGEGSRDGGKRYGLCCPNNMAYRDFVRAQMAEFSDYFDFEGVFLDMTFWPLVCYCDECRARWEREVGGAMPAVIDWNDSNWRQFDRKRHEWMEEFAFDMTAEIKKHTPDCAVEHQFSTALHPWRYGVNESMAKASDYAGGDLYGGIAQQSFACKLYYNLTRMQPFEYMTSRCYPSLAEHTTNKSMDQLVLSVMMTCLHHGACLIIDAIDPAGTHDRRVYEKIGRVFEMIKPYEKYLLRGEQKYDVGVFFNLNGKMDVERNNIPVGSGLAGSLGMPHFDASFGAAESLRKHHIPYSVLNNWRLDLIENVKVLILSDVPQMTAAQIEVVTEYVRKGGNLYLSGHSAPEMVERFFGGKIEGLTEHSITYISPVDGSDWALGEFTSDYPLAMFERAVKLAGQTRGTVLGTLTLPYTVPNPLGIFTDMAANAPERIPQDDPRYPFASIHANPPGIHTDYPALLKTTFGRGAVIWSCVPFEKADRQQHSDIFAALIRSLIGGNPAFSSDAPQVVEFVEFDAPDCRQKYIGMVNLQEDFYTLPVDDINVHIASETKPQRVFRACNGEPIDFSYADGNVSLHIDRLVDFDMYVLCD